MFSPSVFSISASSTLNASLSSYSSTRIISSGRGFASRLFNFGPGGGRKMNADSLRQSSEIWAFSSSSEELELRDPEDWECFSSFSFASSDFGAEPNHFLSRAVTEGLLLALTGIPL
ncbi:unnamed protein product [Hymenolepis diminuta]|uniref:Uncharacterized protein n=1 Tax=Hymenolepis diminuta TaxID=6216 RepID=A0A3P7BAU8_HYMDI|nr:unnamed protein product [Hymenolepis diminuta]